MMGDPEMVLRELRDMLCAELYDSVEAVGTLFISSSQNSESALDAITGSDNALLGDVYEVIGDALLGKKEYRRAHTQYQLAEQSSRSTASGKKMPTAFAASDGDARLRLKQAKCLQALRDIGGALKCLESIPTKFRTALVHRKMGDLFLESNIKRSAILCYREALLLQPLAVELVEKLADLGSDEKEVLECLQEGAERRGHTPAAEIVRAPFLAQLAQAFSLRKSADHRRALAVLKELNGTFPRNLYLLSRTAYSSSLLLGQDENTLMVYRHIHKVDRHYVQHMDAFAAMLSVREELAELNKLTSAMMEAAPSLPQPWICAAFYSVARGDAENALSFIDKAILLSPQYAHAFVAKGRLQSKAQAPELALIAFSQAHSLEKSLPSLLGIIDANLQLSKVKEAANWAKECLRMFPKEPEVYFAMGNVLAKSANAPQECVKAYTKALKLQPKFEAAAVALGAALVDMNRTDEAIDWLQKTLQKVSTASLRLQLARALAAKNDLSAALDHLQVAGSLPRTDELAQDVAKEVERVEALLREEAQQTDFQDYAMDEEAYLDDHTQQSLNFDE